MDNTLERLKSLVHERGLPQAAAILGHQSTQRLDRWLKNKSIPSQEQGVVKKLLDAYEGGES